MRAGLFDFADALGVRVVYADLTRLDRDGDYNRAKNIIRLQEGMSFRLHRCVLAHELAHAVFGDVPSKFGPVNAKQERRADEWAALRLIDRDDYRHAEETHDGNPILMAQELDVIVDILTAYQRILLRVGDVVYVDPRMGAGQWEHRVSV